MASLEAAIAAEPEPLDVGEDELALMSELKGLEDQHWLYKENTTTDHKFKRRLESSGYYLAFTADSEFSEYRFFLTNIEYFDDKVKALALDNAKNLVGLLNQIIDKLS